MFNVVHLCMVNSDLFFYIVRGNTMKNRVVEATVPELDKTISTEVKFPETLDEAVKMWGEDIVFTNMNKSVIIQLQSKVRGMMRATGDKAMTEKDIIKALATWVPKKGRESLTAAEKMQKAIESSGLNKEEILAMLK